jgi:hypothetical protein
MNRKELAETIIEDEDFYYFVNQCLRIGARQIVKDVGRGVENVATKRFKKLDRIYDLKKNILRDED